jgi:hypothetical protein
MVCGRDGRRRAGAADVYPRGCRDVVGRAMLPPGGVAKARGNMPPNAGNRAGAYFGSSGFVFSANDPSPALPITDINRLPRSGR